MTEAAPICWLPESDYIVWMLLCARLFLQCSPGLGSANARFLDRESVYFDAIFGVLIYRCGMCVRGCEDKRFFSHNTRKGRQQVEEEA